MVIAGSRLFPAWLAQQKASLAFTTYQAGKVFFAVSVWDSKDRMQEFARGGLHGQLTDMAMDQMAMFFNHSQAFENQPDRKQCVAAWKAAIAARDGKGTVGIFSE